jgi:hypothetical protein
MEKIEFKRWLAPLFIGLIVGAGIVGLVWYLIPSPQTPTSLVHELQPVNRDDAAKFAREYGKNLQPYNEYLKAFFVSGQNINDLSSLLSKNPEAYGIRLYPGIDNGRLIGVIALTDASGVEMHDTYYLMENPAINPCPPVCDKESEIIYPCPPNCDAE